MLSLLLSTLAFFIAAWYLNRYLDEQGIGQGMTRGALVLVLASLLSWGAGAAVDWVQVKIDGPQATPQADLPELLKAVGSARP
ncbi:MAG: hypothetical protein HYZ46_06670 [Nitrosomonadales bacterium]|nr:hypothetical protein [Nitrosomonadales bacterium]